jgi:hypothetical protein
MNAIIALCHFCHEHGPRTLFCTQAFKYMDEKVDFNLNQQTTSQQTNDSNTLCRVNFKMSISKKPSFL